MDLRFLERFPPTQNNCKPRNSVPCLHLGCRMFSVLKQGNYGSTYRGSNITWKKIFSDATPAIRPLKTIWEGPSLEAAHWRRNLSGALPDGKAICSTLTQLPVRTRSWASVMLARYLYSPEAADCISLCYFLRQNEFTLALVLPWISLWQLNCILKWTELFCATQTFIIDSGWACTEPGIYLDVRVTSHASSTSCQNG